MRPWSDSATSTRKSLRHRGICSNDDRGPRRDAAVRRARRALARLVHRRAGRDRRAPRSERRGEDDGEPDHRRHPRAKRRRRARGRHLGPRGRERRPCALRVRDRPAVALRAHAPPPVPRLLRAALRGLGSGHSRARAGEGPRTRRRPRHAARRLLARDATEGRDRPRARPRPAGAPPRRARDRPRPRDGEDPALVHRVAARAPSRDPVDDARPRRGGADGRSRRRALPRTRRPRGRDERDPRRRAASLHRDVRRRWGHGAVRAGQGGRARRARRRERWAARVAIRDRRSADDEYSGPPIFARRGHPCRHARGRGAVARGGVHGDPRGRAHVKWWLIAWREIRWEVFLDRASLLRMSIFIVIPMLFIFSNRRIPLGTGGDLTLVALAAQSVFFPALSGVALIAATFTAEKENGTLVPLLAAPIRDFDIVLGKLVGMVLPVMAACAVTLTAGYALAGYRYGYERVARVLTPELLYAVLVLSFLYLVTTGSVTMIVAARVRSSRAAQQIAGLVIALSAAVFAGLGLVASQVGEGWPLLGLGVALVLFDLVALEVARR